jgi:CRISPR-associated endoribonuclease Cas6
VLGVLTLSPIAISDRSAPRKRWHTCLDEVDLSAAANARLSRLAARDFFLNFQPDSLYHCILRPVPRLIGEQANR